MSLLQLIICGPVCVIRDRKLGVIGKLENLRVRALNEVRTALSTSTCSCQIKATAHAHNYHLLKYTLKLLLMISKPQQGLVNL